MPRMAGEGRQRDMAVKVPATGLPPASLLKQFYRLTLAEFLTLPQLQESLPCTCLGVISRT